MIEKQTISSEDILHLKQTNTHGNTQNWYMTTHYWSVKDTYYSANDTGRSGYPNVKESGKETKEREERRRNNVLPFLAMWTK
jgi:hypothetical protein